MKSLNKTILFASLAICLAVAARKSFAEEGDDKKKYKSTACTITHGDGTTSNGNECYLEDSSGTCSSQTNCS